nr:hypothetical protein [uncultured Mediterranean phage uvMED]
MTNIFNSTNWPKYPPETFVAGDYFAFKRDDLSGSFPLTSYVVKFYASQFGSGTGATSANQISLNAIESGSEYQITAGATATNSWAVGKYQWSLFVEDSSDAQKRQLLDNGVFEVKPNWASSTADPRSDARKNLELIEDILYNRVQGDVSSYSIAGRSLSKMSPDELIELRDFYARQVLTEKRNERIRQKKGTGANILADFRR